MALENRISGRCIIYIACVTLLNGHRVSSLPNVTIDFNHKAKTSNSAEGLPYMLNHQSIDWLVPEYSSGLRLRPEDGGSNYALKSRRTFGEMFSNQTPIKQFTIQFWLRPIGFESWDTVTQLFSIGKNEGSTVPCTDDLISLRQGDFGRLKVYMRLSSTSCDSVVVNGFEFGKDVSNETVYQVSIVKNYTDLQVFVNYVDPKDLSTFYFAGSKVHIPSNYSLWDTDSRMFVAPRNPGLHNWVGDIFRISLATTAFQAGEIKSSLPSFLPDGELPKLINRQTGFEDEFIILHLSSLHFLSTKVTVQILQNPEKGKLYDLHTELPIHISGNGFILDTDELAVLYKAEPDGYSFRSGEPEKIYASLSFRVHSGSPVEGIARLDILVEERNDPPVASSSSFNFSAVPGAFYLLHLPAMDIDDGFEMLRTTIVNLPERGQLFGVEEDYSVGLPVEANVSFSGTTVWYRYDESSTGNSTTIAELDTFYFAIDDAREGTSQIAAIAIQLTNVLEGRAREYDVLDHPEVMIALQGVDALGRDFEFVIHEQPEKGILLQYDTTDSPKHSTVISAKHSKVADANGRLYYWLQSENFEACTYPKMCSDTFWFMLRVGDSYSAPARVDLGFRLRAEKPVLLIPGTIEIIPMVASYLDGIRILGISQHNISVEMECIKSELSYLNLNRAEGNFPATFLMGDGVDDIKFNITGSITDVNAVLEWITYLDLSGNSNDKTLRIGLQSEDGELETRFVTLVVHREEKALGDAQCSYLYGLIPVCSSEVPAALRISIALIFFIVGPIASIFGIRRWLANRRLSKYKQTLGSKIRCLTTTKDTKSDPNLPSSQWNSVEDFLMVPSLGPAMLLVHCGGSESGETLLTSLLTILEINHRANRLITSISYYYLRRCKSIEEFTQHEIVRKMLSVYTNLVGHEWALECAVIIRGEIDRLRPTTEDKCPLSLLDLMCRCVSANVSTLPRAIFELASYLRLRAEAHFPEGAYRIQIWLLLEVMLAHTLDASTARLPYVGYSGSERFQDDVRAELNCGRIDVVDRISAEKLKILCTNFDARLSAQTKEDLPSTQTNLRQQKAECLRYIHHFMMERLDLDQLSRNGLLPTGSEGLFSAFRKSGYGKVESSLSKTIESIPIVDPQDVEVMLLEASCAPNDLPQSNDIAVEQCSVISET